VLKDIVDNNIGDDDFDTDEYLLLVVDDIYNYIELEDQLAIVDSCQFYC
jgi:hypothetical protein